MVPTLIRLTITTQSDETHEIEAPDDLTVTDFISELASALKLGGTDGEGRPVAWQLDNRTTGRRLESGNGETLQSNGVADGHELRLWRVVVAGRFSGSTEVMVPSGETVSLGTIRPSTLTLMRLKITTQSDETHEIEARDDITVTDFISELLSALKLGTIDHEGRPISWCLDDKKTGRRLTSRPGETLQSNGVATGHELRLWRVVIAGCFSASTEVLVPSGETMSLGTIRPSTSILIFDPDTRRYFSGEVEGVLVGQYPEQIIINSTLVTTPDQHFFLEDGGPVLAKDLRLRDRLLGFPFRGVTVTSVERVKSRLQMISLTLPSMLCFVAGGIVVRDLIGKQPHVQRPPDVFLSYTVKDRAAALDIHAHLVQAGKVVFLAEQSISAGSMWESELLEALRSCRHFWVLCSSESIRSEWVQAECAGAWALGKRITPILLGLRPEDLPERLRAHHTVALVHIQSAIPTLEH